MDNMTARIIGGVYIALCGALSAEAARLAHDCLYGFADSPDFRPEDQHIYRLIANAASRDPDELRAENAELDRHAWLAAKPQPVLRVVQGGKSDDNDFTWFAAVAN